MNLSRYILIFLIMIAVSAGNGAFPAHAGQPSKASEHHVKAAFIYNFAKFVEWPDQMVSPENPLVLCVIGRGPARSAFNEVKGQKVRGRDLDIMYNDEITDPRQCNIIYISSSDAGRATDVLESVRGKSVLTIGESPEFIRSGGIINFTSADKKIRFEINLQAALRARLSISSQLLKLADIREGR